MSLLKNHFTRAIFFIAGDATAICTASLFSYLILNSTSEFQYPFPVASTLAIVLLSVACLAFFKMYQVSWRFTSLRELMMIINSLAASSLLFMGLLFFTDNLTGFQVSFAALVFIQSILYVGAFRISKRMSQEVLKKPHLKKRAVIFGAGNAGDQIM